MRKTAGFLVLNMFSNGFRLSENTKGNSPEIETHRDVTEAGSYSILPLSLSLSFWIHRCTDSLFHSVTPVR